jgi:hypothetical protein
MITRTASKEKISCVSKINLPETGEEEEAPNSNRPYLIHLEEWKKGEILLRMWNEEKIEKEFLL